jgi:hypothetical protein
LVTYDRGLLRLEGPTSGRAESSRKRGTLSTKKAAKRQKINDWVGDFQRPTLADLTKPQTKCRFDEWSRPTWVTDSVTKSANVAAN